MTNIIKDLEKYYKIKIVRINSIEENYGSNSQLNLYTTNSNKEITSLRIVVSKIMDIEPISEINTLEYLNIGHNRVLNIKPLEKLIKLKSLLLYSNLINDITPLISLKDLNYLNIGGLKRINISKNEDAIFTLKNLSSLKTLIAWNTELSNLNFLKNLTNIEELYVQDNSIKSIEPLKSLINLRGLYARGNYISDLSPLTNLKKLNQLELLNNKISDLRPLKSILTSNFNKINFSNGSVFDSMLTITDNSIQYPPVEVVQQGYESVISWFSANKKELKEVKVILIGDPKAGKTSILKRLKYDVFEPNEEQTDGINIESIDFEKCPNFEKNKKLHSLTSHFWDFGGQEIMNATHQFFLTNRSVYIIVLDARKDNNVSGQIRQWVKKIRTTGGNSPIIVVCNQIDINTGFGFDNEFELRKEFPQIKKFIKVSSKTNENFDALRDCLEDFIPSSELFRTEIDERWLSLKEKLQKETLATNFIDEAQFRLYCKENQLENKSEHDNAIKFLHDLGIVLHFEDTEDMKDYFVIDPYWITYGVYQILTSKYVGENKGKVEMDKLDYILNQEEDKKETYKASNYRKIEYSIPQRRFLVDILHQFKLCFYLPGKSHFIVPDLLDTIEPIDLINAIESTEDKIKFVYKYDYLPKSVVPNLMVELNKIITSNWRTGCILENNESKALISSYDDRLSITVIGEHKKKREFLSVIRYVINSINDKLKDEPSMLIPLPETNEFVEYEVLLEMEKDGEKIYKIYKPKKQYEISHLLEGIIAIDNNSDSKLIIEKLDEIKKGTDTIINKLDVHFNYLISRLGDSNFEGELLSSINQITSTNQLELSIEIFKALIELDFSIDEKLNQLYSDLKKSDNIEAKIKLGIPLLHLITGCEIEVKFDIKKWSKDMYKKYKLDIFKRMGYIG